MNNLRIIATKMNNLRIMGITLPVCYNTLPISADLPKWASAAGRVALIQPSSAAAEPVFSILASSFGKQQESSLEDYIQLSVMMQYNYEKSK